LKKLLNIALFLTIIIVSCKKEELPVPKHDAGNVITSSVDLGDTYKWQIYFNLESNSIVSQNLKTIWDLGFENGENGTRIVLNSSKFMFARNTNNTNFTAVTDTLGFEFNKKWDHPSGNLDSTAIGNWQNTNNVYIIDRGYSETGIHQGFRKLQILAVSPTAYNIRFALLNGSSDVTLTINKTTNYNLTHLSFATSNTVIVEPEKTKWDIVYTQYTHTFFNPVQPYLVTGCLLNRYKTTAYADSTTNFSDIKFDNLNLSKLSTNINTIGFTWKNYTGSNYVTKPQNNFVIKNSNDYYFKLHFIDFYNQSGEKGSPKWEYQKL
jgi:hypothetical protein